MIYSTYMDSSMDDLTVVQNEGRKEICLIIEWNSSIINMNYRFTGDILWLINNNR
jgi:hypothetical protein